MDEKMVGIMEETLHKLEELTKQVALKGAIQQLSRSVRNDNIIG